MKAIILVIGILLIFILILLWSITSLNGKYERKTDDEQQIKFIREYKRRK